MLFRSFSGFIVGEPLVGDSSNAGAFGSGAFSCEVTRLATIEALAGARAGLPLGGHLGRPVPRIRAVPLSSGVAKIHGNWLIIVGPGCVRRIERGAPVV